MAKPTITSGAILIFTSGKSEQQKWLEAFARRVWNLSKHKKPIVIRENNKPIFEVDFGIAGTAYVKLHLTVLEQVDDNWRKQFYDLTSDQEIAEHIAYNEIVNHWTLSQLDGFANLPDDYFSFWLE